jgi:polyhydroxybutyrate depolymerase
MYTKIKSQGEICLLFLICAFMLVGCSSSLAAATPPTTNTSPTSAAAITYPIMSEGCGQKSTVLPGDSQIQTIFSDQLTRSYLLHIPIGYKDTVQQPLVLNFHGHGSNSQHQAFYSNFSSLANQQDFIVVYPQGTIGPDKETGWATGPARDPQVNDVLFVSDILNKLQSTLCINPSRIYATGFSNGGGMTDVLACKMAGRIAAFAPVSGSYPPVPAGCNPMRPVPILEFHGTADQVVPYNGSVAKDYPPVMQWLQEWVTRDGCTINPVVTHPVANVTEEQWGCQGNATIIHYQLAGWPHAWPHIEPHLIRLGHNPSRHVLVMASLDATSIIWTFFEEHPLP